MQQRLTHPTDLSRVPALAPEAAPCRPGYAAARLALGLAVATILGGVIGVAGWLVVRAHRHWHPPTPRRRRAERVVIAVTVTLMGLATFARARVAMTHVGTCPQFTGVEPLLNGNPRTSHLENAITWAPSGFAVIDVWATGGTVCRVPGYDSYVGLNARFYGRKAVSVGNVYLLRRPNPHKAPPTATRVAALTAHEERHRGQWAVATAMGGPLAFPTAYAAAESVFPGARNPFERAANLRDGGYNPSIPESPHPQPDQIALLLVPGALLEALSVGGRLRRRLAHRPERRA